MYSPIHKFPRNTYEVGESAWQLAAQILVRPVLTRRTNQTVFSIYEWRMKTDGVIATDESGFDPRGHYQVFINAQDSLIGQLEM